MAQKSHILELGKIFVDTLYAGKKILFFGNGGSAADSQHLATELVVRYRVNRPAMPAIALTTDTSALTATANDFGYDQVFSRQVEGLGQEGDLAIGISTSGNSTSVINGIKSAKGKGLQTLGFSGNDGGQLAKIAEYCYQAPSEITATIQECHIIVGHLLCDFAEKLRD